MQMNQPADEEEAGRLGRLLSAVASASAPNFGSWRAAYKLWQLINNRAGPGGSNRPLRGGRVLFSCGDEEWQIVVEGAARTSAQALLACRAERTVSGVSTGDTQQLSAMLGGKLLSRNAWMGGVVIAVMEVGVRVPSAEQCGVLYDARLRDKQRSQHSSMDESIKHGADLWVKALDASPNLRAGDPSTVTLRQALQSNSATPPLPLPKPSTPVRQTQAERPVATASPTLSTGLSADQLSALRHAVVRQMHAMRGASPAPSGTGSGAFDGAGASLSMDYSMDCMDECADVLWDAHQRMRDMLGVLGQLSGALKDRSPDVAERVAAFADEADALSQELERLAACTAV